MAPSTITLAQDVFNTSQAGDGTWIETWRNGFRVERAYLDPATGPLPAASYTQTVAVNQGDALYFHVNARNVAWDDTPTFNPIITMTAGSAYNTWPDGHKTTTDFGDPAFEYKFYHQVQGTYTDLVYNSVDDSYDHPLGYSCRIWADRQHPLVNMDCVTVWTAPADGLLRVYGPAIYKQYTNSPVGAELRIQAVGSSTPELVDEIDDIQMAGKHFDQKLHVRAGDKLYLHIRNESGQNLGMFTKVTMKFEVDPLGAPPQVTSLVTAGNDYEVVNEEYFFDQHIKIPGDIIIGPMDRLELRHCIVEFQNVEERDHQLTMTDDAELWMYDSVLGGNRTSTGTVLHSNFIVRDDSKWISRRSETRYTYGHLTVGNARLDFVDHNAFVHGDLINVQHEIDADLVNVSGNVNIELPLDNMPTAPAFALNLPVETFASGSLSPSVLFGTPWQLDYTNLWAYFWMVRLTGLSNTGQAIPIDATGSERIGVRLSKGTGIVGTMAPPKDWTQTTTFNVFNSLWTVGPNTVITGWAADFQGGSDVRILGPIRSSELIMSGASRLAFVGTPGTFDAETPCTTLKSGGANTRMVLDNVSLGTNWTRGEIKATDGGRVSVRDIELPYQPVRLLTEGAGSRIIVSTDGVANASTQLLESGNTHLVHDHWSFDDKLGNNYGEFRNWDPHRGFVDRSLWTIVDVANEPNNGALHLDYLDPASYSGDPYARIVTPRYGDTAYVGSDAYLFLRMRAVAANDTVLTLEYSAREAGTTWSTWGAYRRLMAVVADGQWHDYCWNVGNPTNNANCDPFLSTGSATSYVNGIDYFGLRFGLGTDTITNGDFVEVDFITLSPYYDAELRN